MTSNKFKLFLSLSLLITFFYNDSYSQTATLSPYSRYGVGTMLFNGFSHQRAMGGISVGLQQSTQLNFGNPASYGADSTVLFELGLIGESINLSNQTISSNKTNGNIAYLSMGFPLIKNRLYLSLGMLPFSASGYNIQQATSSSLPGNAKIFYEGSGGFNRFYAGTGFRIGKKLYAGINGSYLYGTSDHTTRVEFSDLGYANTELANAVTAGDLLLDGGIQYTSVTKSGEQITLGVSLSPSQKISAKRNIDWVNYVKIGSNKYYTDTVLFTQNEKGTITLPLQAGFGISVSKKDKWLIGAEIKMMNWQDYESYGIKDSLKASYKASIGGQWIPDAFSVKYFGRAAYRAGLYYNKGYLELKNETINDIGLSFGAGFPLRGKPYFSHLDLSFEFGQEGTTQNNLVRQRYGRVILGLTIREDWFRKPKFD